MRKFLMEDSLKRTISKSSKKDKVLYEAVMNKIEEVLTCEDVNHYKNLKKPLEDFKRVHIKGPFVLIFKYNRAEDQVIFFDLDHHDKVYS
ncbi:addiction module toxin RelE [Candidatus Woesearchaeota archaeon]|nr:MAG: hypothetical protein QS99_C0008G0040 [archaeon GW2011_AR4]MBS3129684.1 addiction module toxin RelE [Candidatus Woesearchaeota archaeon]HIH38788.1 addiction module toxin RelE [Candidatus Woesearchaeota archaeon]HIJ03346.1 addiction module toxin RelE [Candidatus Woesearchaeota archaeon]